MQDLMKKLFISLLTLTIMSTLSINAQANEVELTQISEDDSVEINEINFPDPVFREYVLNRYDGDDDGRLSSLETTRIDTMIIQNMGITSLKGIEYFPHLKELYADYNEIESLDVSKNTELIVLKCSSNRIKSLDMSNNEKIQTVRCSSNGMISLNVSNCPELTELGCGYNELSNLDISKNVNLVHLSALENNFGTINLKNNVNLKELFLDDNNLTELDLSNNLKLTNLTCYSNHLAYLDLRKHTDIKVLYSTYNEVEVNATQENGNLVIQMSDYIPDDLLSRVGFDETDDLTYDAQTGKLTLLGTDHQSFEYSFKSLDKELGGDYNQYMWINASINVVEEKAPLPFNDVNDGDWYYDYVEYVYNNGLMTGLTETTFGPRNNLARAQFAVILYRMNGSPKVEYISKFPDVTDNLWYTDAILWANSTGVVTGYTATGLFGPNDYITREQMAVMMYRYANYLKKDTSKKADFDQFKDASSVSSFAQEAMQWAVGNGIITGKDNGTRLDPQGNANRAECATIIMRFLENL